MEKATVNMKIGIIITVALLAVSCVQVSNQDLDKKEFNIISSESYAAFVNSSIYPKRQDDIFIYDKFNNESVIERYLVKSEDGVIYIKPIFPTMGQMFIPIEKYNPMDDTLKGNLSLFFRVNLKRVSYNRELGSLIISTAKATYLHQLSMNPKQAIPEAYLKIQPNWYYFNK